MKTRLLEVVEGQEFECGTEVARLLDQRLAGFHSRRYDRSLIKRFVGHLTLSRDLHLRIRSSKAGAANLLAWAAYVDPTLEALGKLENLEVGGQFEQKSKRRRRETDSKKQEIIRV